MKKNYYIAYGSNLHTGQMFYRCPKAIVIGTAELKDWRLTFKGKESKNYATIEPCEGFKVPVAIWEITDEDEISLDRYEGFPEMYFKQTMKVDVNNKEVEAIVYIMNTDATVGYTSNFYIETLRYGYHKFRFDMSILDEALNRCK